IVSAYPHSLSAIGISQPVFLQTIDESAFTKLVAESGFWQIIGNTGHIFHPSSDDDLVEAKLDALSSEHNCLHTRCANFIDRSAGNGVGQTSFEGSLPGRSLPQIG